MLQIKQKVKMKHAFYLKNKKREIFLLSLKYNFGKNIFIDRLLRQTIYIHYFRHPL